MNEQTSVILTVEEAADLLRIPRSSVYKLAQEGKIPAQKVGKHWRFNRSTLLQWVATGGEAGLALAAEGKRAPQKLDFS